MNDNRFLRGTLLLILLSVCCSVSLGQSVLVEAESFSDCGGWKLDQQFMDQMGSPYLLAHGLGEPVGDAVTTVTFPSTGTYKVWVRTFDWVSPWKKPETPSAHRAIGTPGQFQLVVGGTTLAATFGTEGQDWFWQDGGTVNITDTQTQIKLHDLTGFDGRCDAILFCTDTSFVPPNTDPTMRQWRRDLLGISETPQEAGNYDLVVIGAGTAGTCAAISAAREGLSVALIQDRPVLGGNSSSEVRVCARGHTKFQPYSRIGDIVLEITNPAAGNRSPGIDYQDNKKMDAVLGEENITLFLNYRGNEVESEAGKITAVIAQNTKSGERLRFTGRCFADCTGDGGIGFLAGADFVMQEVSHMGRSNLWRVVDTGSPTTFPACSWAIDLSSKPFKTTGLGDWYWESGYDHNPIEKGEYIRDWNLRAMYGAWDSLKNVKGMYQNSKLQWAAYISGKRESRRLLGDLYLEKTDLQSKIAYSDGCVPTTWSMDLHVPHGKYVGGFQGDAFFAQTVQEGFPTPYWVPYRCLYSRNIENLFMAGRDISVSRKVLGTVRVQNTTGMMGEVVGKAAAVCKMKNTTPRGVYTDYLHDLFEYLTGSSDTTPPAVPANPSITGGSASIMLDWDDNSETDFKAYNIYRSTTSGNGYSWIASTPKLTSGYTDASVQAGVTYYYVVTAVDVLANESDYSNEKSGSVTALPDTTPPADPANLSITSGSGSIVLDWNDNGEADLDAYNIYRSTTSGNGYSLIASTSGSTSNYTDTSVQAGVTYYYVVTAVDDQDNESGYSNEMSGSIAEAEVAWDDAIGPNHALDAAVDVSSTYNSTYDKSHINDGYDGYNNNERWMSANTGGPAEIIFSWPSPKWISAAKIISGWDSGGGVITSQVQGFHFEYYNGQSWEVVSDSTTNGNSETVWKGRFSAVQSADADGDGDYEVKLVFTDTPSTIARIWEVKLFHPHVDLNNDGTVDLGDLAQFSAQWLHTGADLRADFSSNDRVDLEDYADLCVFWGW